MAVGTKAREATWVARVDEVLLDNGTCVHIQARRFCMMPSHCRVCIQLPAQGNGYLSSDESCMKVIPCASSRCKTVEEPAVKAVEAEKVDLAVHAASEEVVAAADTGSHISDSCGMFGRMARAQVHTLQDRRHNFHRMVS